MSTIVDCPSCNRKLRVPDELLGKKVKCPTCSGTFDAQSAPAQSASAQSASRPWPTPPPSAPGIPQLSLEEGKPASPAGADSTSPAPPVSSESPSDAAPPSEQETLSHHPSPSAAEEELEPCPYCGEKNPKGASRCSYCREDLEDEVTSDRPWDRGYRPYRDVRRDSEPHRATLILTLGIVSIVMSLTYLLSFVGLIIGICAWLMGQGDLKKMRSNVMDPQGYGSTQAGWICGIIGTAFGGLFSICCVGQVLFYIGLFASASKMSPPAPAPPIVRPAPPPAQKKKDKVDWQPRHIEDRPRWA